MCGIAGIHEWAGRRPAARGTAAAMLDTIVHRGPDEHGLHAERAVAFGTRRLSIIDLAAGQQPIASEDGGVVVAFNGEIYNYRELRRRLSARGHVLRTQSDTEVIAHLYEDLGEDCLHELRGMFGVAIWDARRQRLVVARDRLGIKPLYWTAGGGRLAFASEIKALLTVPGVGAAVDHDALAAFLLLKYVPAPRTLFAGIQALPPGHLLVADADGVRVRRWWDVSFRRRQPELSERAAVAELRERLEDSVRAHLVSDVPFGAFLSGGVDSSTVVALMSRELGRGVSTFSVGFEGAGAEMSELPYARMVAERYGTDHHEVLIGAGDFIRLAEKVVWHLDQPIADNACLPNYMVAELASAHVKMVLTGEGGDELFAGYARYAGERLAPLFSLLPAPVRRQGVAATRRSPGLSRPGIALYALCQPEEGRRLATWFPLMHPDVRDELATGALGEAVARAAPESLFAEPLARTDARERLNRMLYVDTKLWLPDDLLARGDKMSMAASLEARVPLLDHHLVEFAAGLPPRMKLKGVRRKHLLKEAVRDLLPAPILSRAKKGFPVPISDWLRGDARDFSLDLLAPDTVRRRGLLAPDVVARMVREHDTGAADHGSALWALLSLELWHQLYVDRASPAEVAA